MSSALVERLRRAVDPAPSTVDAPPGRRPAAVLILADPRNDRVPLLFIVRSEALRHHAGQIAFPGGGFDAFETNPVSVALREAQEEVGLQSANVEILGSLPTFDTMVSHRWLTPVVGLMREGWEIQPDAVEVADWFWIDLAAIMDAPHEVLEGQRDGEHRTVHFIHVDGQIIWGVTGAIVAELVDRIGEGCG